MAKKEHQKIAVLADASLLPALLNLINNAIRATKANNSQLIEISSESIDGFWQLTIRDFGKGFTLSKLKELGVKPVDSEEGLGMAVFLSHASLERLGGKLALTNHVAGGALVTLSLPLTNGKKS
jgi:two-component system sensor histidine kinase RegB